MAVAAGWRRGALGRRLAGIGLKRIARRDVGALVAAAGPGRRRHFVARAARRTEAAERATAMANGRAFQAESGWRRVLADYKRRRPPRVRVDPGCGVVGVGRGLAEDARLSSRAAPRVRGFGSSSSLRPTLRGAHRIAGTSSRAAAGEERTPLPLPAARGRDLVARYFLHRTRGGRSRARRGGGRPGMVAARRARRHTSTCQRHPPPRAPGNFGAVAVAQPRGGSAAPVGHRTADAPRRQRRAAATRRAVAAVRRGRWRRALRPRRRGVVRAPSGCPHHQPVPRPAHSGLGAPSGAPCPACSRPLRRLPTVASAPVRSQSRTCCIRTTAAPAPGTATARRPVFRFAAGAGGASGQ